MRIKMQNKFEILGFMFLNTHSKEHKIYSAKTCEPIDQTNKYYEMFTNYDLWHASHQPDFISDAQRIMLEQVMMFDSSQYLERENISSNSAFIDVNYHNYAGVAFENDKHWGMITEYKYKHPTYLCGLHFITTKAETNVHLYHTNNELSTDTIKFYKAITKAISIKFQAHKGLDFVILTGPDASILFERDAMLT